MFWVIIFGAIALAGLVMIASYGVWLVHKAADVMSEIRVLAASGASLAELAGQVQLPQDRRAQVPTTQPMSDLHKRGMPVDGDVG